MAPVWYDVSLSEGKQAVCTLTEFDELEIALKCVKADLAEALRTIANELLLVDELLNPDAAPWAMRQDLQEAQSVAINASGKLAKIAYELERSF